MSPGHRRRPVRAGTRTGGRGLGSARRAAALALSPATTGTGRGRWRRAARGPDGRGRLFAAMWGSWHAAVAPGTGAGLAPLPGGAPGLVVLRDLPRASCVRQPDRGAVPRRTRRARGLPAPQPGDGRGRQPPRQEPEGTGRPRGVLRRRRACLPARSAGCAASWPSRCCRTAVTTNGRPPTTARCSRDLIDIDCLLRAAGQEEPAGLPEAIAAMRRWLGAVLTPRGRRPAAQRRLPGEPGSCWPELAPAAPPGGPLHVLPDTGLARATAGGWHLLADIGPPCPRELPAHAHADTLSCVVHVDGEPLLIDTGTSTYAPGAVRDRERSTVGAQHPGGGLPRLHRGLGRVPCGPPGPGARRVGPRGRPAR